jgi:hypothetical protein
MVAEVAYDVGPGQPQPVLPPPLRRPAQWSGFGPSLRLVPPPRTVPPSRREAAYVAVLGLILAFGTLGVLLLNTLMQQQARTIAAQRASLSALALHQQTLQLELDAADNPRELARRAVALHMRPATLTPLRPAARGTGFGTGSGTAGPGVSARGRGTLRGHAG